MKILIEITERELSLLKHILRISNEKFEFLYRAEADDMSPEGRIVRARKLMGMSMMKSDVCHDCEDGKQIGI